MAVVQFPPNYSTNVNSRFNLTGMLAELVESRGAAGLFFQVENVRLSFRNLEFVVQVIELSNRKLLNLLLEGGWSR